MSQDAKLRCQHVYTQTFGQCSHCDIRAPAQLDKGRPFCYA